MINRSGSDKWSKGSKVLVSLILVGVLALVTIGLFGLVGLIAEADWGPRYTRTSESTATIKDLRLDDSSVVVTFVYQRMEVSHYISYAEYQSLVPMKAREATLIVRYDPANPGNARLALDQSKSIPEERAIIENGRSTISWLALIFFVLSSAATCDSILNVGIIFKKLGPPDFCR